MGSKISKGINCFHDLPDPVVANIISLLPIHSITRCRAVCKSWLRLISGIDFNNCVYQKRGIYNTYVTLIVSDPSGYNLLEFNVQDDTLGSVKPVKRIQFTFEFGLTSSVGLRLVGCCNGLLCIEHISQKKESFKIWNPVLGEYISIPEPRDTTKWFIRFPADIYGFGYCPITGQYKVLKGARGGDNLKVLTLSPNTTSWRSLGKSCCRPCRNSDFHYLNGVIHWICRSIDKANSDWIHCFDCATEQQYFLRPPCDCLRVEGVELVELTSLRNRLCLVHFFDEDIVLWVMENYGHAESWIKHSYHNQYGLKKPTPIVMQEDKNILFLGRDGDWRSLCYYIYDEKSYVITRTTLIGSSPACAFSYTPTFVPLLEVFKTNPAKMPFQQSGYSEWLGNFRKAIRFWKNPITS